MCLVLPKYYRKLWLVNSSTDSVAVVSPVLGIEIVFAVGCTEIVVPACKVTIVEKETALPITLVEKLRVSGWPLNEIPNPNGEEPGKVVDAEKLISYTPVKYV